MLDGGGSSSEMNTLVGFETEAKAIEKYEASHDGRGIVRWGPLKQPIKVIVKQVENQTRTFLDLGGADLLPVRGNDDDDITDAVSMLQNVKPDEFVPGSIHVSRLNLRHLSDPKKIPDKNIFVLTGGLKSKPQEKK